MGAVPAHAATGSLEVVGQSDLGARGLNAGLAVAGSCAYVGSRGEGPVAVVDITDPAHPSPAGELAARRATTPREVRAYPEGGWLVVVFMPLLVYLLHSLGVHEQRLDRVAAVARGDAQRILECAAQRARHYVLVAVGDPDRVALHAVAHVLSLVGNPVALDRSADGQYPSGSASIQAVHVTDNRDEGLRLQKYWADLGVGVQLVILESPFRAPVKALLRYVEYLQSDGRAGTSVTIVIPETLPIRWWHPLLRNYLAWSLKWSLLFRPRVSVLSVPLALPD